MHLVKAYSVKMPGYDTISDSELLDEYFTRISVADIQALTAEAEKDTPAVVLKIATAMKSK